MVFYQIDDTMIQKLNNIYIVDFYGMIRTFSCISFIFILAKGFENINLFSAIGKETLFVEMSVCKKYI